MMSYIAYYNYQVGGGGDGVKTVYIGSRFQRGHGIGSFLGGLLRGVLPYLKSGARFLSKEAFKTGINVIDDIENRGSGFREAVKERSKETIKNLKRRAGEKVGDLMLGSGYKNSKKKKKRQSVQKHSKKRKKSLKRLKNKKNKKVKKKTKSKKKKVNKKAKLRKVSDIFG